MKNGSMTLMGSETSLFGSCSLGSACSVVEQGWGVYSMCATPRTLSWQKPSRPSRALTKYQHAYDSRDHGCAKACQVQAFIFHYKVVYIIESSVVFLIQKILVYGLLSLKPQYSGLIIVLAL